MSIKPRQIEFKISDQQTCLSQNKMWKVTILANGKNGLFIQPQSQRIMKIIPLLPPAAEEEKGSIVDSKHPSPLCHLTIRTSRAGSIHI